MKWILIIEALRSIGYSRPGKCIKRPQSIPRRQSYQQIHQHLHTNIQISTSLELETSTIMRAQQLLALSGLVLAGNIAIAAKLEQDDVPNRCWEACGSVVGVSRRCDNQHDNNLTLPSCNAPVTGTQLRHESLSVLPALRSLVTAVMMTTTMTMIMMTMVSSDIHIFTVLQ